MLHAADSRAPVCVLEYNTERCALVAPLRTMLHISHFGSLGRRPAGGSTQCAAEAANWG